jgi:hypothetical protein
MEAEMLETAEQGLLPILLGLALFMLGEAEVEPLAQRLGQAA